MLYNRGDDRRWIKMIGFKTLYVVLVVRIWKCVRTLFNVQYANTLVLLLLFLDIKKRCNSKVLMEKL